VPSRSKITGTVVEVTGLVSHECTFAQTDMPCGEYFPARHVSQARAAGHEDPDPCQLRLS
jgi:hypothetical protein